MLSSIYSNYADSSTYFLIKQDNFPCIEPAKKISLLSLLVEEIIMFDIYHISDNSARY